VLRPSPSTEHRQKGHKLVQVQPARRLLPPLPPLMPRAPRQLTHSPPRSSPASLGFMFSADDDCCSAGGWEEAERDPLDLVIMIAGMGGEAGAQVEGESAAEQSELLRGGCVKRIPLVLSPPAQREPRQPLPPQGEGEGAEEGEGAGAGAGAGKVEGEKVGGREGDDASTRSAATTGASPPSSASASSCAEGEFIDIESLLDLQDSRESP